MYTHVIILKDRTHNLITKEEANKLFAEWAAASESTALSQIQIPRGEITDARSIDKISDIESWIRRENSRLQERRQVRCKNCLEINNLDSRCACRERDKPMEYELGGTPANIVGNLERKMKDRRNPPEELWRRICEGVLRNHQWARDWKAKGDPGERYEHAIKVKEAEDKKQEPPKFEPKWWKRIKGYSAICFRANCYQKYLTP